MTWYDPGTPYQSYIAHNSLAAVPVIQQSLGPVRQRRAVV